MFRLFYLGDIVGSSGRIAIQTHLPAFKTEKKIDFVVANVENAAHGFGLTPKIAKEIFDCGIDAFTGGNHIFDKKEVNQVFQDHPDRVVRPANYPPETPGRGSSVVLSKSGTPVGIVNVMGKVFMEPQLDCPFRAAQREVGGLREKTKLILVDIHAEVTSEKQAMAVFLDGQVSCVVGSHTHVPTADERIYPNGTGFLTDAGMNGPYDSIIGMQTPLILHRFLKRTPMKMEVAEGPGIFQGVIFDLDPQTGRCVNIERVRKVPER